MRGVTLEFIGIFEPRRGSVSANLKRLDPNPFVSRGGAAGEMARMAEAHQLSVPLQMPNNLRIRDNNTFQPSAYSALTSFL